MAFSDRRDGRASHRDLDGGFRELGGRRIFAERFDDDEGYSSECARLEAREDRMIKAIMDGYANPRLKQEMADVLARKTELEHLIASTEEAPVLMHPNMGARCREEVTRLFGSLNQDKSRAEAIELILSLVDFIVITPDRRRGGSTVDVHGDLAGILNIAAGKKETEDNEFDLRKIRLVAGLTPHDYKKTAGTGGGGGGPLPRPNSRNLVGEKDLTLRNFNHVQDKVVDLSGEESNQIFAEMARWEQVLKDTSLAKPPEPPSP